MESFYFKYSIKMFSYDLTLEVNYIRDIIFLYKMVERYIYLFYMKTNS